MTKMETIPGKFKLRLRTMELKRACLQSKNKRLKIVLKWPTLEEINKYYELIQQEDGVEK